MKKIISLLIIGLIVFSCQKKETQKKHWPVTSEHKKAEQNNDSLEVNNMNHVTIKLPNDRYVVIILEPYSVKIETEYEKIDTIYKPKKVKVFDSKTKKEIPESRLDNYYTDEDSDPFGTSIWYGDFNFDGKMDVAVRGLMLGYRNYCSWNFYLATEKGYQYSKDFSKITDVPFADIKLDKETKTISVDREVDWHEIWVYKTSSDSKLELVKHTKDIDNNE